MGEGWMTPTMKMAYSEPTRAQSCDKSSRRRKILGVFLAFWFYILIDWHGFKVFLPDSDWLPTTIQFWAKSDCLRPCIKVRSIFRQSISIGYRILQCTKIRSWVYWLFFGTVRFFEKKTVFELFLGCPPPAGKLSQRESDYNFWRLWMLLWLDVCEKRLLKFLKSKLHYRRFSIYRVLQW